MVASGTRLPAAEFDAIERQMAIIERYVSYAVDTMQGCCDYCGRMRATNDFSSCQGCGAPMRQRPYITRKRLAYKGSFIERGD